MTAGPDLKEAAEGIVHQLYKEILKREPDPDGLKTNTAYLLRHGLAKGIGQLIEVIHGSAEFKALERARLRLHTASPGAFDRRHNGPMFRVPDDLTVSPAPMRRVLLVGACLIAAWQQTIADAPSGCPSDHLLANNYALLPKPRRPLADYDFQVVSLPLRTILPETAYLQLGFDDEPGYAKLFRDSCERIDQMLNASMRWSIEGKLLTFVTTFLVPQQNPMGRLLRRNDFRNLSFLVARLNEHLADKVERYANSYVLDIDAIAATFGKKYVQDDPVSILAHGSVLDDYGYDRDRTRIMPQKKMSETYEVRASEFVLAIWAELVASYRTIQQSDQVKLVIVDLDDTLWRGVLAEGIPISGHEIEGWPLGVVEALAFLKKRGTLLAIVSKNEESFIRHIWPQVVGERLRLEDFAFLRINWDFKVDSVRQVIADANLLPGNVVFIDDNPAERAAVAEALPGIRVLGENPYFLRRILLWSPETQVATVTRESLARTEMVRAAAIREDGRSGLSRDDFIRSLEVKIVLDPLPSVSSEFFPRVLELTNKTNQFNTTGKRWTTLEVDAALRAGTEIFAFWVRDRYSDYGLVGVVFLEENKIVQFLMSCRVLGLGVELRILELITDRLKARGQHEVAGVLVETERNHPCRDLFASAGFRFDGEHWVRRLT